MKHEFNLTDAIRFSETDDGRYKTITASVALHEGASMDKDALRSHPEAQQDIKKLLAARLQEKLYGGIRDDARRVATGLMQLQFVNYGDMARIRELMQPLFDAGTSSAKIRGEPADAG